MLRVASVPSAHPYVHHLAPVVADGAVVRLPDPPVPGAAIGQWWPSPVLDPTWLRTHAAQIDVVHLHFGFEHHTAAELVAVVATLRALALPLVLTVHDLTNPHLSDQRPHLAALDVLVPAASEVVTLTPGAAAQIARRWGRQVRVLAHPHVVPLERLAVPRPAHAGFAVGLHDKARANNDPDAVRGELARVVAALPGARLVPSPTRRLSDDELWDHLAGLDVLVLAYRHGTHSGFVEACHDLGTTVVAPRVGFLCEQHPVLTYDLGEPGSLSVQLRRAYGEKARCKADPVVRAEQRNSLAAAHEAIYRQVAA